jgi:hypothetical protein
VAKLHQHQTNGTYFTTRYEDGFVTRRIHPDGVVLLNRRGVRLGGDIPPFAMADLVARNWLYTDEEAGRHVSIDWAPDWDAISDMPARSQDWIQESTGWARFETSGMATAIETRQDGFRWSALGVGAVFILISVLSALLIEVV